MKHTFKKRIVIAAALIWGVSAIGLFAGTAQASQADPLKPTGRIYVYGQAGRYSSVKIEYRGSGVKKCGANLTDTPSSFKIKKIPLGGAPLVLTCAQTNLSNPNDGYYLLTYTINGKTIGSPVNVDVGRYNTFDSTPEQATYVHFGMSTADPVADHGSSDPDTPPRTNITVTVTPQVTGGNVSARKKTISGEVKVIASPARELSRAECSGTITIDYATSSPGADSAMGVSYPLKYVKLRDAGSQSYCRVKFTKKDNLDPGTYTVTAHVPQTTFFNAANANAAAGVVVPKR